MKLKLIQSGGFAGRSKFAEEDLSSYSQAVRDHLERFFLKIGNQSSLPASSNQRDAFQYFIEINGNRFPVNDEVRADPQISAILEKLKGKLHY